VQVIHAGRRKDAQDAWDVAEVDLRNAAPAPLRGEPQARPARPYPARVTQIGGHEGGGTPRTPA